MNAQRFRFLDCTLPTITENLALDEALLEQAEFSDGPPILRTWEATQTAVILGASGRIADDLDLDDCQSDHVIIARRSSGGGTVVIGPGALNLTVVLPIDADPTYRAVDTAQISVLNQVANQIRTKIPEVTVAGSGDLVLHDRKFSGSAQRRLKHWFLVHASILYQFPLEQISRYTRLPKRQPEYRKSRDHRDFITNISLTRSELLACIQRAWIGDQAASPPDNPPLLDVARICTEKLDKAEWVYRF